MVLGKSIQAHPSVSSRFSFNCDAFATMARSKKRGNLATWIFRHNERMLSARWAKTVRSRVCPARNQYPYCQHAMVLVEHFNLAQTCFAMNASMANLRRLQKEYLKFRLVLSVRHLRRSRESRQLQHPPDILTLVCKATHRS